MLGLYQRLAAKGQPGGYASLGTDGKVPAAQLPGGLSAYDTVEDEGAPVTQRSTLMGRGRHDRRVQLMD